MEQLSLWLSGTKIILIIEIKQKHIRLIIVIYFTSPPPLLSLRPASPQTACTLRRCGRGGSGG